jgi:hypothetical protein
MTGAEHKEPIKRRVKAGFPEFLNICGSWFYLGGVLVKITPENKRRRR